MSSPRASLAQAVKSKKKKKCFVEAKGTALQLASAIADSVEEKTSAKAEKNRRSVQVHPRVDSKTRMSSKSKLKEVKLALKTEQKRAKKEKVKARKRVGREDECSHTQQSGHATDQHESAAPRKSVAFA